MSLSADRCGLCGQAPLRSAAAGLGADRPVRRLSAVTKQRLCQCLNPPNPRGNDWRMLAQMMQVNRSVEGHVSSSAYEPGQQVSG